MVARTRKMFFVHTNSYPLQLRIKYLPFPQAMRREIFEDNVALIAAHNADFAKGLHTFEIGLNQFADMTDKEFFSTMNGFVMEDGASSSGELYEPRQVEVLCCPENRGQFFFTQPLSVYLDR